LAKKLHNKKLVTIYDADYIAPASDGSLVVPQIKRFFRFEKNIELKIIQDCAHFLKLVLTQKDKMTAKIPPIRFSTFINAPNKFGSGFVTMRIHLHQDACIKCNLCVKGCPYNAFKKGDMGSPVVMKEKCTNCYRCIHNCPTQALSLFKKKKHKRTLKY
jgi:ferredoxin